MSRENLIKDQGIFSSVIISNKSEHKHKTTLRTEGGGGDWKSTPNEVQAYARARIGQCWLKLG